MDPRLAAIYGILLRLLLGAGVGPALARDPSPQPCTHENKQIALYLDYLYRPGEDLVSSPATDISVDHIWNSTSDMRKFGRNGVYAANPIGFGAGVGGYFGSQADGDASQGGLLFSIWDKAQRGDASCAGSYGVSKAPNSTWCKHLHSFPLSDNCHRHCLDCGLHPGWRNTSGTQCSVPMRLDSGDSIRFRLWQTKNHTTLPDPLGMGITYEGSIWSLTATNLTSGQVWMVGKMFFEGTYSGVTRFGAFHEHIGCTPCSSFYESEIRRGPFAIEPGQRQVHAIAFTRKNVSCELYEVDVLAGGVDAVPAAQISTGPGTGPDARWAIAAEQP